tara:strand:- start:9459 stop:9932 length:474 start_codon:yes stop_codon:yes gene_type:complete
MSKTSVGLIAVLIGIIVWLSLQKSCSAPVSTSNDVWHHRIDSLLQTIEGRDTLLISSDSVIYRTTKTKELITEYRYTSDTVTKIVLCDSIVVACDSLADQFVRQDSIFREQVSDLKLVVVTQDSVILDQSGTIKKLKRNNRILIGLSVALGVIAGLK